MVRPEFGEGIARGYIIPIGGGEDKDANPVILSRFVALAGEADANIVVLPTASKMHDTGARYERIFRDLGAGEVSHIGIAGREDCNNPEFADRVGGASGIFITGGNQLRLSSILGGTNVARAIRKVSAAGVPIAGTSAGASIMSEHMMAGGGPDQGPTEGGSTLAPGLGLTNVAVIDQHFTERNRLGRLLSAIALNPFLLGMGIDEDTAAFMGPDGMVEIVGSGAVTIANGQDMTYSSAHAATPGSAIGMLGLKLDILHQGCGYDLKLREAFPPLEQDNNLCNL